MNNLQRILLTSGLAATASLMANLAAFADTTATVSLSGIIPTNLTFTVVPESPATALPLIPGDNNRSVRIGYINGASTNNPSGLKVNVSGTGSLASGSNSIPILQIQEASGISATLPEQGAAFSLAVSNGLIVTRSSTNGLAPSSTIFINYTVPPNQAPGTYTGSITFTAVDN